MADDKTTASQGEETEQGAGAEPEPEPTEAPATGQPQGRGAEPSPETGDGGSEGAEPGTGDDAEQWKQNSRKWEERSKRNKEELDAANEKVAKLQQDLAAEREAHARDAAISAVSERTGVPSDLLAGCKDEGEAEAMAKRLTEWASSRRSGYPTDKGGAPAGAPAVTKESIEKIKDPVARVRARAAHPSLYRRNA